MYRTQQSRRSSARGSQAVAGSSRGMRVAASWMTVTTTGATAQVRLLAATDNA